MAILEQCPKGKGKVWMSLGGECDESVKGRCRIDCRHRKREKNENTVKIRF